MNLPYRMTLSGQTSNSILCLVFWFFGACCLFLTLFYALFAFGFVEQQIDCSKCMVQQEYSDDLENSTYENVLPAFNLNGIQVPAKGILPKLSIVTSLIGKPCRRNTGILIQRMRDTQRQINRFFQYSEPDIKKRWEAFPSVFGSAMNGFRYALKPFKYWCRDEYKHFLEFSNPNSSCNHVTLGVGGSWTGEQALRRKYPQCRMLGVDSVEHSRRVVEADPNSRFVHAMLTDDKVGDAFRKELKAGKWKGKQKPALRGLSRLLMSENEGRVIDFMTIDVEGAEYILFKDIHRKRHALPVICQFNMEVHHRSEHYNVTWEEFDDTMNKFLNEAHFILLNVDARSFNARQLFFINIADDECIQKFLC